MRNGGSAECGMGSGLRITDRDGWDRWYGVDGNVPFSGLGCARARTIGHGRVVVFRWIGARAGIAWARTWAIFGHNEMCPAGGLVLRLGGRSWNLRILFVSPTISKIDPWGETIGFCRGWFSFWSANCGWDGTSLVIGGLDDWMSILGGIVEDFDRYLNNPQEILEGAEGAAHF